MVSSQSLGALLLALSALLMALLVALLVATIPHDHVITVTVTVTLPLWLSQLHRFATADPLAELRSRLPPVSSTMSNCLRASRDDDNPRTAAVWRKIAELLDDLVAQDLYPFSSDQSGSAASPLGAYDMWRNDEDEAEDLAKDSDACARLYRDSKQHQVCAISI